MRNIFKGLFLGLIISLFIMRPVSSYADDHRHDDHGHDSGHGHDEARGHDHGHDHSSISFDFSVSPDSYYYNAPYYQPAEEVYVSAPVYQPVFINGTTYYLNNGTYYVYNGYGYQAVMPPVTVVQPPVVVVNQALPDVPDSITINIPNQNGGFTAVTLRKSGNGFIGPQGEFYTTFPSVNQLKVVYGK